MGCTIQEYKAYLERTFTEGMSWDLYRARALHVDHIIPCSCFDLSREDHQRACFHCSNTRMLFAKENLGRTLNRFPTPGELEKFVRTIA